MESVSNPHDKYFKATFGKVEFAKGFLNNYLPEELKNIIDMSTLEQQQTNYIDEELKEQFTDLLFRVNISEREAYIYFLFEHKSYRDRMVIFQILKYMLAVWEAKIKDDIEKNRELNLPAGEIELPIIIPLVVYHDKYEWNVKKSLGEMMPGFIGLPDIIKRYVPNFEYILSELPKIEDDPNLSKEQSMVIKMLNRTRYVTKEEVIEIFTEVIMLFKQTKDEDIVGYILQESATYILSVREDFTDKELFEIASKISKKGGELVMTGAEKLIQKGMERGIEKGRQEGELRRSRQMAKDMLINGEPMEKIELYTRLDTKDIYEIKKDIK